MKLKAFQKKYLKSVAHDLNPSVIIGKNGVSADIIKKINAELLAHELIKIKSADRLEHPIKDILPQIVEQTGATVIKLIGSTAVLYKENPENTKDYFKANGGFGQKAKLRKNSED